MVRLGNPVVDSHPKIGGYFGEPSNFAFVSTFNETRTDGQRTRPPRVFDRANLDFASWHARIRRHDPNVFALPSRLEADLLVAHYFEKVQHTCPYIYEPNFRERYQKVWSSSFMDDQPVFSHFAYLSLLNMVFALSSEFLANFSHEVEQSAEQFVQRAENILFSENIGAGSIETVQALLLMNQYLQNTMELNRCWFVSGVAIRTAQSIGLHLDPTGWQQMLPWEKEVRKILWWGCYVTDRTLSMMSGRPPVLRDDPNAENAVPLPTPEWRTAAGTTYNYDTSESAVLSIQFLNATVRVSRINESALTALYGVGSGPSHNGLQYGSERASLGELSYVVDLDRKLNHWQNSLPKLLHPNSEDISWQQCRLRDILNIRFSLTRILCHRKNFVAFSRLRSENLFASKFEESLVVASATECVLAAETIMRLVHSLHVANMLGSRLYCMPFSNCISYS